MNHQDAGGEVLGRLRDLSQVSLEGLLAGTSGKERAALVAAYAEDLEDALAAARAQLATLWEQAAKKPDPLAFIDAPRERRAAGDGAEAAALAASRMRDIAAVCRELATLYATASAIIPKLAEADRHR